MRRMLPRSGFVQRRVAVGAPEAWAIRKGCTMKQIAGLSAFGKFLGFGLPLAFMALSTVQIVLILTDPSKIYFGVAIAGLLNFLLFSIFLFGTVHKVYIKEPDTVVFARFLRSVEVPFPEILKIKRGFKENSYSVETRYGTFSFNSLYHSKSGALLVELRKRDLKVEGL